MPKGVVHWSHWKSINGGGTDPRKRKKRWFVTVSKNTSTVSERPNRGGEKRDTWYFNMKKGAEEGNRREEEGGTTVVDRLGKRVNQAGGR